MAFIPAGSPPFHLEHRPGGIGSGVVAFIFADRIIIPILII